MTQQLLLPNYSALGSIVHPDLDRYEAQDALVEAGWRDVGSGAECVVYASPDRSRVVKLVRHSDAAAPIVLRTAQAYPDNPHLPKVYGTLEGYGWFAAETEFLNRCGGQAYGDFCRSSGPVKATFQPKVRDTVNGIADLPDGPLKEALQALSNTALDDEPDSGNVYVWDCHDANIMVRPSTGDFVLNDPLYRH